MSRLYGVFLLLILACAPVHAGFFDNLFRGPGAASSVPALPSNSISSGSAPIDSPAPLKGGSDYRLGAGDKIAITVFNEKDLSIEVRLSDAGSFLYPFIGEVPARGMTMGDLQRYLANQLSDGYLVDPKVYVNITEYRPFFVNGEVTKPGGYPYQPGLTVRKAISLAGGFTPRASLSKIFVIHEDDSLGLPRQTTLSNELRPGDIITVDQGFF